MGNMFKLQDEIIENYHEDIGMRYTYQDMVEDEDGVMKVQKVEGSSGMYLNQNWRSQNMLIAELEVGEDADKAEIFDKWNKDAKRSVVLGFCPDLSNYEAELSACNSVVSTKVAAILTGSIDPADPEYGVEAIKKDMQKAGSAKVVTLPARDDIDFDFNEQLIVEFYSK